MLYFTTHLIYIYKRTNIAAAGIRVYIGSYELAYEYNNVCMCVLGESGNTTTIN